MKMTTLPGRSFPLGATVDSDGINFSISAKKCTAVELLLLEKGFVSWTHHCPRPMIIHTLFPRQALLNPITGWNHDQLLC